MIHRKKLRRWLPALLLVSLFSLAPPALELARADEDPNVYVFRWPDWQNGTDVGLMALGHFGRSNSVNSPPGGLMLRAQYHYWYDHLVEGHIEVGVGLSSLTLLAGVGFKVNLMEYIEDVSGKNRANGIQRGLIASVIPNFMIFASLDIQHYQFPTPNASLGLTYSTSPTVFAPGLGIQWFWYYRNGWARRLYFETSGAYTNMGGADYVVPFVGLGAELK